VAVAFIVSLSSGNDMLKEKQFLKLRKTVKDTEIPTIRGNDGTTQMVNVWELVVGDIILIETGNRVPGDCMLIEGCDITVDEAYYNDGKKTVVQKDAPLKGKMKEDNPDSFLLTDSIVLSGTGKAVVMCVGKATRKGIEPEDEEEHTSPLQDKLERIGGNFGKFGIYGAIIIFLSLTIHLAFKIMIESQTALIDGKTLKTVINYLTVAITIIIVAVPEGLPLAVSISLAYSVEKMQNEQVLVKNIESPEIMGGVEEICTGKTSTLTTGDMYVDKMHVFGKLLTDPNEIFESRFNKECENILNDCIFFNSTARVEMDDHAIYVPNGNPTECGMLKFMQRNGTNIQDEVKQTAGRILT